MNAKNKINFVGKIKTALVLSAVVILSGIISVTSQGGLNYNIEFNGGYLVHAGFYEKIDIAKIRSAFSGGELTGIDILEFGDTGSETNDFGTEVVLKVETSDQDVKILESKIAGILNDSFGEESYEIRQASSIGPKVGDELKSSTLKAIFWSLLFILIYITIKFRFRYGIAAIVALFHDVFVTVGIISLLGFFMNIEISLSVIAAILTIVGYSLNDTIVVFDRIRENVKKLEGMDFDKIVNVSINETLTRTILTSATTLFVVVILFIFGGEVIRDLSLTLLIGISVGTYSSIFIASPLLMLWERSKIKKKLAKA
jgi:preprotein translocase subunit SecF